MANHQSDLFTNFIQQTHLGTMNLITLVQNLPGRKRPQIPEITYDEHGRYLKSKQDDSIRTHWPEKSMTHSQSINEMVQQRTSPALPSSSIETKMANFTIDDRYKSIGNEFHLSLCDLEKQYQLALNNRIEIPPILMRRIVIDAIGILRIMMNELNEDVDKNREKLKRISKRLKELEVYNELFGHHC